MRSCSSWQLYVIVDRAAVGRRDLVEVAAAAIRGGADVIQLRDKTASASARRLLADARHLLPLARASGIPLIINDRVDFARASGADGVHLGQDDLPLREARLILGRDGLIGTSTHTFEQAVAAAAEGADYIGVGPIFPTPTKPHSRSVGLSLIRQAASHVHVPIVCIGGIDASNVEDVIGAGARCIAVVRAVCSAPDPESAARTLKTAMTSFLAQHAPSSL